MILRRGGFCLPPQEGQPISLCSWGFTGGWYCATCPEGRVTVPPESSSSPDCVSPLGCLPHRVARGPRTCHVTLTQAPVGPMVCLSEPAVLLRPKSHTHLQMTGLGLGAPTQALGHLLPPRWSPRAKFKDCQVRPVCSLQSTVQRLQDFRSY